MRNYSIGVLLGMLLVSPVYAQKAPPKLTPAAVKKQAEVITVDGLRSYLTFIASDALQGRDTPSPGLDVAAEFLAFNLRRFGAKPGGGDGTYFQKIPMVRGQLDVSKCSLKVDGKALVYGEMFLPGRGNATAEGEMVYVGHGYQIPGKSVDAYKGVDVKGKVLVIHGGMPEGVGFRDLRNLKVGTDYFDANAYAAKNGAAGVVTVVAPNRWSAMRQMMNFGGGRFRIEDSANSQPVSTIPMVSVLADAAESLFAGSTLTVDKVLEQARDGGGGDPVALKPSVQFSVANGTERIYSQNVVAIIEGSDPKLKAEYVALGAHYDHVGVGRANAKGDAIFNGADDDGSGTVAILAIAQAFATAPVRPARSLIFVWHMGEEKGLLGSDYFVNHPTVPLDKIVAQLNLDMIGRSRDGRDENPRNRELSGPDSIYVIGSKLMSTTLGKVVEDTNKTYKKLEYDLRYDDPNDPNRFFYRSDHFNYAKKGIPIAFWFDGVHEDYHQQGDEVSKIDFNKMRNVTQTVFLTAWEVASLPTRPAVDKKPEGIRF